MTEHDLPESWTWTSLENCVDVLDSQRIPINAKERETRTGEIPYYGATGQVGWIDDYIFDEELVLLGEDGAPFLDPIKNKSYIIKGKSWVNNHAHVLRALNGISLNRFINYYLNNFSYNGYVTGTTRLKINQAPMRKIPVPLAPLAEQHRIVARIEELFSRLDAGVVALQRAKIQLQRYRQSVLKAAVEGKLTEEWRKEHPDVEPAEKLLERISKKRYEIGTGKKTRKNCSEMGQLLPPLNELPETWTWAKWEQVGISQNGRLFPSKEYQSNGFKLLRPGNLHSSGKVVWTKENTRYLPESWAKDFPLFVVGPRELVMNLTAQSLKDEFLGRICITGQSELCLLNQRIARLAPIEVQPEYLLWMFKSQLFRKFVNSLNTGSLIQHMFTSQLADFILPLPPLEEQLHIVSEIERLFSIADNVEDTLTQNLRLTESFRQSILKSAFEGRLVPQDPNDEPASVLLEQIRAERTKESPRKGRKSNNYHQMRLTNDR
jgi:type I restriction enzyme S subunit